LPVRDEKRRREIVREISPVSHVTPDDPPTLILHGDADTLVPIQQAEVMIAALEKVHVPAKLVRRPGAGHGWPKILKDVSLVADWFDTYLAKPAAQTQPG
jgi:dipeptidyl aminopeptidase/acylaminoacyl peptidase